EGPAVDPEVLATRTRRRRALMSTLLVSQGVPMIRHGDEIGHTQHGNDKAGYGRTSPRGHCAARSATPARPAWTARPGAVRQATGSRARLAARRGLLSMAMAC